MIRKILNSLFIMFFSPFLGLYLGFKSDDRRYKRWLLIIFITFYGSLITIWEENDGYRHQLNVYDHYVDLSLGQFLDELYQIVTFETNPDINEDPYIHVLSFFVGGILRIPGMFFVFVSFIYAYFYVGSMFRIFQYFPKYNYSKLFFGFAVLFIMWKSIEGINTVRTWTGLWVLFYACISYYQTRNKKYIVLMFMPPLIHFGYLLIAIPVWLVLILGVRKLPYVAIFVASFSFNFISPPAVTQQLEETELGQEKVKGYYREEKKSADQVLEKYSANTWYKQLYALGVQNWGVVVVAGILILFGAYFKHMNSVEAHLFSMGLLIKVFSNSTWFLTDLSSRSAILCGVFILAPLLMMWQRGFFNQQLNIVKTQKVMLTLAFLVFVPFIIYRTADIIYFVSANMFIAPIVSWLDPSLNHSIREVIGMLLGI